MRREEMTILLTKAHYGLLERAEQARVDALLRDNAEAKALKLELDNLMASDPFLTEQAVSETWEQFVPRVQETMVNGNLHAERPARRFRRWAAAAAVLAIITTGIWLLRPANQAPEGLMATLTLTDGRVIALKNEGSERVETGDATLTNTNRVLRLESEGADAPVTWNTLTVPRTLDYKVYLPDSSVVWLNSTTVLRFPSHFAADAREVQLESGEAYFEVAELANAPFTVYTPQGAVQVWGTSFNVDAYQRGQVLTSLVSGRVTVAHQDKKVVLQPMQQAVVADGAAEIRIRPFDLVNTVSWREGVHYFNNASVAEIGAMLERWFNTELVLDNDRVGHVQFRGKLDRNRPLQQFIDAINLTGDAEFYWKDGVLHVK